MCVYAEFASIIFAFGTCHINPVNVPDSNCMHMPCATCER